MQSPEEKKRQQALVAAGAVPTCRRCGSVRKDGYDWGKGIYLADDTGLCERCFREGVNRVTSLIRHPLQDEGPAVTLLAVRATGGIFNPALDEHIRQAQQRDAEAAREQYADADQEESSSDQLQQLLARKSELLLELADLEAAIASFGDHTPVRIRTRKNIRNTAWVETDPCRVTSGKNLLVFADREMTRFASPSDHYGWVTRQAWTQFQVDHPEMMGLIYEA